LVVLIGLAVLGLIYHFVNAEGWCNFEIAAACVLITLVITSFKSADFAKHLLE
jgi:hypothetical protein